MDFSGLTGLFGNGGGWGSLLGGLGGALGSAGTGLGNAGSYAWNNLLPSSSNPNWNWSTGLAGLSTLGGAATGAYNMAHQAALQRQIESLAKKPYDVNQFYQPMSDAAMAALQRAGAANAVSNGIPPSYYTTNLGPELQAKTETERWAQAQQMAMQARQNQLNALMGRPQLPTIGDIGAFGNAMMTNQLRDERLRLQQQNQGNYNRMLDMMDPSRWGNWGSPASTTGQAAPYYLSNQPASNWGMPGGYGFPQSGTAPAQGSSGMSTIPGANSSVPDYTTEAY